jgi:hypothetical protein
MQPLNGYNSWVGDIIYKYKGNSELEMSKFITATIRINIDPSDKDKAYVEECSDSNLLGKTVVLESEITDKDHVFDQEAYLTEARSSNIPIQSSSNNSITSHIDGSIHPTKKPHLDTISYLCANILNKGLSESPQTDADKIIRKIGNRNIKEPIQKETLRNFLSGKKQDKKLITTSANSFNSIIKVLCLMLTEPDAPLKPFNPNISSGVILSNLKKKGLSFPVSDSELLTYFDEAPEIEVFKI